MERRGGEERDDMGEREEEKVLTQKDEWIKARTKVCGHLNVERGLP